MQLDIQKDIRLSEFTTLQVGGRADLFVVVSSIEEFQAALQYAQEHTAAPPLILGGGSNLLISDEGYRGLVVLNQLRHHEVKTYDSNIHLVIESGANLDETVALTVANGWWGMENLSGIPGTVGATPIQNVGAYGVEVASLIVNVEAIHTETLEHKSFTKENCRFAYRDSYFKSAEGKLWAITSVTFELSMNTKPQLEYKDLQSLKQLTDCTQSDIRTAVLEIRARKFPDWHMVGTAGSFFKNPIISTEQFELLRKQYPDLPGYQISKEETKVSLGWILDKVCGLRGHTVGALGLYKNQALVLINIGGATANEIQKFAASVATNVKEKTDIEIEWEVTLV